jgi:hypothetical protein
MTRERAASRALCEPEPLTRYLKGGSKRLNKWRNVRRVMEADSVFRVDDYYFAAREERYVCFPSISFSISFWRKSSHFSLCLFVSSSIPLKILTIVGEM